MARLEGITGGLSGKMGSAVFRQSGGKTIASQYQPIVKNPNSEGQQNTRATFKLMSQLAAVMKDGFGTMGINERPARGRMSQRNAFIKLNYPLVTVSAENAQVTATIAMEKVKLTSSFRNMEPILPFSADDGTGIRITLSNDLPKEITTVRLVTIGYKGNIPSLVDLRDVPNAEVDGIVIKVPAGKYTVLGYGLIPSETAKSSIDLDNIHTPADQDFISAIQLDAMVANGSMVETMTVGANVTVA